jgi:hypothetical protein
MFLQIILIYVIKFRKVYHLNEYLTNLDELNLGNIFDSIGALFPLISTHKNLFLLLCLVKILPSRRWLITVQRPKHHRADQRTERHDGRDEAMTR